MGMYPRIFTGIGEPWINLLEIEVCDVRFQMLRTENFKAVRETLWNFSFSKCVTTSKHSHPVKTFGFDNVFGGDFLEAGGIYILEEGNGMV